MRKTLVSRLIEFLSGFKTCRERKRNRLADLGVEVEVEAEVGDLVGREGGHPQNRVDRLEAESLIGLRGRNIVNQKEVDLQIDIVCLIRCLLVIQMSLRLQIKMTISIFTEQG